MERLVAAAEPTLGPAARAFDRSRDQVPWLEVVRIVRVQMRSLVGAGTDLEDLTQTALERLVRGVSSFEGQADFATYSYRVCVRVALNHWRGWRRWLRRFELGISSAREPAAPADVEERADRDERARRLHALLKRLPPGKRLVLVLVDLEELPVARVSEILGCPQPTVRSRLREARLALARLAARDPVLRREP